MLHQRFASGTISSDDVHHAGGQTYLVADFRKCKRSERRELGRLQDDGVSGRQSGRNLPRQHQQRKVPWNDLSHNTASRVVRKLLLQQLRPAGIIIKMSSHQWNIDVAALANRLSIVHGFEHGEAARMLLYLSRERIQVT